MSLARTMKSSRFSNKGTELGIADLHGLKIQ